MNENSLTGCLKDNLDLFCNTREKTYKIRNHAINYINPYRQMIYNVNQIVQEKHNAFAISITITFPRLRTIEEEWTLAGKFINNFKERLSRYYPVIAGIIAVEPHKNSTLKSKRGKNTKAGRPHFHAILWIAHAFICPPIAELKQSLILDGTLSRIKKIETDVEIVKTSLYITKEKGNKTLNQISKKFMDWDTNINIWINHPDLQRVFEPIAKTFKENEVFVTNENYNQLPTTYKYKDQTLVLAEIYRKVFIRDGFALKGKHVYEKESGTHFTWKLKGTIQEWIAQRFHLQNPPEYTKMLKDGAGWIANSGSIKKFEPKFELFPQLVQQSLFVEFKDKVYDFYKGNILKINEVAPQTSTFCFINKTFNECEPPFVSLGLLTLLISGGNAPQKEKGAPLHKVKNNKVKNNKVENHFFSTKKNKGISILSQKECFYQRIRKAIRTFGGLFHPYLNRKMNPALFLSGPPSTYKTFLILNLFKTLILQQNIDVLARQNSRFNLWNLKKEGNQPYTLIMDDLRWEHLGMPIPDLINLLDGHFVSTEQKFGDRDSGELRGSIAITSNQNLNHPMIEEEKNALTTRINQIDLFHVKEKGINIDSEVLKLIERETVGFAIICNAYFLATKELGQDEQKIDIPESFYQKTNKNLNTTINKLTFLGKMLMEEFLFEIEDRVENKSTGVLTEETHKN
jgi:hypothetical protein